jgi:hypothetical protein
MVGYSVPPDRPQRGPRGDSTATVPLPMDSDAGESMSPLAVSALVDLYIETKSDELLSLIKTPDRMNMIGTQAQGRLLESGVTDLEEVLLEHLWQAWNRPGDRSGVEIVQPLGRAGSARALEMREVIRYRTAGELPEARTRLGDGAEILEYQASERFLAKVRDAIKRLNWYRQRQQVYCNRSRSRPGRRSGQCHGDITVSVISHAMGVRSTLARFAPRWDGPSCRLLVGRACYVCW